MSVEFSGTRLLVVGSANADLVTEVSRCPRPGETLIGGGFKVIPGGKGANQAVAGARLGGATSFAGRVGADSYGTLLSQSLAEAGVDTRWLAVTRDAHTGVATIFVAEDGENVIVVSPGANGLLTPDDVTAMDEAFANADVVLTQFEIPLPAIEAVLDMARRHGVLSVLDAGGVTASGRDLVGRADVISPNETEAATLTGRPVKTMDDARAAAEALRDMGAPAVVMKLGRQGALYVGGDSLHVPACSVEVVDTTAAGDAFTAALALGWRVMPVADAVRYANVAGALACAVAGAQPSMPTARAVEGWLAK